MKKLLMTLIALSSPLVALAEEAPAINTGDTAWILISTALVMSMTPAGLALFYGGMTRSKNILNTMGMSFGAYAIASIVWVFWGYSIAFGPTMGGIMGGLNNAFMNGIGVDGVTGTVPTLLFAAFQLTFAGITVALISGAIIERAKFSFWLLFCILWLTVVYAPVCHWVWGGGFLMSLGALDFAGGTVVHINAGFAGLVLALLLGKRKDMGKAPMFPSTVVMTGLGAALLWFGWFGFNAGSALGANGLAANALLVTNTSAATGVVGWLLLEYMHAKRLTMLGIASGAVAGLVAITPAAGFVGTGAAALIGLIAGFVGFFGVFVLKNKLGYDDSLDAFGVHGLAGLWGAIATGIFADPSINSLGTGLVYGNTKLVGIQIIASLATVVYTVVATVILYYIASALVGGARVSEEQEMRGLDETIHGEKGFNL